MNNVEILHIDITKIGEKADAIVNAANSSLLGGGGIGNIVRWAVSRAEEKVFLRRKLKQVIAQQ